MSSNKYYCLLKKKKCHKSRLCINYYLIITKPEQIGKVGCCYKGLVINLNLASLVHENYKQARKYVYGK